MMTEIMISNNVVERRRIYISWTGPRTDPCGTPNGKWFGQDHVPDMLML